jgi:hypothetical protein
MKVTIVNLLNLLRLINLYSNHMKLFWISVFFVIGTSLNCSAIFTWNKLTAMTNCKRDQACSFVINNMAYICCGLDTNNFTLKDLWQYDATLDVWTQKADLPGMPRRKPFSFEINNLGYIGGGISDSTAFGNVYNDFYEYNGLLNTWTLKIALLPFAVYKTASAGFAGKGYVIGGRGSFNYESNFYEYDPISNLFNLKGQVPISPGSTIGRDGGIALATNNKLYFGFGRDNSFYLKDWYSYNFINSSWDTLASFVGNARTSVSGFVLNNRLYVGLGFDGSYFKDFWEYDIANDNWIFSSNFDGGFRRDAVGFSVLNIGYIATGKSYGGVKQDLYQMAEPINNVKDLNLPNFELILNNNTTLFININNSKNETITIIDYSGRVMNSKKINTNNNSVQMDISSLNAGLYLLKLNNHVIKFVKI